MNLVSATKVIAQQIARVPVTCTIGLASLLVAGLPSAAESLQFNRSRIAAGEVWRLATAHLTHWNAEHLQWDLLMFVVLGAVCEMRDPWRMRRCVAAAAAGVSTLVYCWLPDVEWYCGLSGIDTALFTLLAVDLLRDARRQHSGMGTLAAGGLLAGLVAKTAYEAATGLALFVDQQSAGFELLVWDHAVAAVVGAVVALVIAPTAWTRLASGQ